MGPVLVRVCRRSGIGGGGTAARRHRGARSLLQCWHGQPAGDALPDRGSLAAPLAADAGGRQRVAPEQQADDGANAARPTSGERGRWHAQGGAHTARSRTARSSTGWQRTARADASPAPRPAAPCRRVGSLYFVVRFAPSRESDV